MTTIKKPLRRAASKKAAPSVERQKMTTATDRMVRLIMGKDADKVGDVFGPPERPEDEQ